MNPDENAREAGRKAVEASRRTLDAIETCIEDNRWQDAQAMYSQLYKQSELGIIGCQRMVFVKTKQN